MDIFSTIQRDLRMQKYLLGKHSPLGIYDQSRLFNTINSRQIDAVLRPLEENAVKLAATSFVGAGIGKAAFWGIGKIGVGKIFNWTTKAISSTKTAKQTRVFWSGDETVAKAAMEYASANGTTTLNMTRAGKNLTNLTKDLPWNEAKTMWQRLSKVYAKGAKGTVHLFRTPEGPATGSIWKNIEFPILNQNNINIIEHIVK